MEDVKLCCRRNQSLLEHIQRLADKIRADKVTEAEAIKKKGGRKKRILSIDDD